MRGSSSPPGPERRERRRARDLPLPVALRNDVFGDTGNIPGYVQWAAATRDGKRSVTTSLNIPAPQGRLLARLRSVQAQAVCALLAA